MSQHLEIPVNEDGRKDNNKHYEIRNSERIKGTHLKLLKARVDNRYKILQNTRESSDIHTHIRMNVYDTKLFLNRSESVMFYLDHIFIDVVNIIYIFKAFFLFAKCTRARQLRS